MKILIINSGSSSLKFSVIDTENEKTIAKGLCERIGIEKPMFTFKNLIKNIKFSLEKPEFTNHSNALKFVISTLIEKEYGVLKKVEEIEAIGHRVVHGGINFTKPLLIDDENIIHLESLNNLAPLHNPANVMGIKELRKLLPNIPNIAVFDTAYHSNMSEIAYTYAIPYEMSQKYNIRKYGFHGSSHKYINKIVNKLLEEKSILKKDGGYKIISCHLGNGASLAAIKNNVSIDTSMGYTPLAGIVMGTRSGDIDPAIVFDLFRRYNMSIDEIEDILNRESGILGIYGKSSDNRDLTKDMLLGDKRAILAFEVMCYSIAKCIGSYYISLQGLDALVFTGGIGENSKETRKRICEYLEFLGVKLNIELNNERISGDVDLTGDNSKVSIFKIETNEELMISIETMNLIKGDR